MIALPLAACLLTSVVGCGPSVGSEPAASAQGTGAAASHPFPRHLPAPSLEGGLGWVNTAGPLKLADLRGKFVLLDFWTYCCINCMHVLPELKKLEQQYPNELVVIGVHSAKFENEQDVQNIREAVERYEISHPVVNDADMTIWRRWGVRSWPTLVLIDPAGEVVWLGRGEQTFAELREPIERGLPYYRANGLLKPGPPPVTLQRGPETPLRFPGKVLADPAGGRLFIADSNHNRIVVADLDGQFQYAIGNGRVGRADGAPEVCNFNHPQGMALVGDELYVADTENHFLRKVDLATRQTSTIAGTGAKGSAGQEAGPPYQTALSSPWALWAHQGVLYIAMAGPHQIWSMPLDGSQIGPYAGNGRENIVDGPLQPSLPFGLGASSFAQPSGLTSDGQRLLVADSEGSAIRSVPFDTGGRVETIVGVPGTLFDFGDVDGVGDRVRLQHPLGVAFHDGKLYVADTYNNKIKVVDVRQRQCQTLAGTGKPGHDDADDPLQATFNEPAGLTAAGDRLFVADTNNHAIRVIDLGNQAAVSTLEIVGLAPP